LGGRHGQAPRSAEGGGQAVMDPRLSELVSRWQQGGRPPPEELCADCPELLAPLRDRLEALAWMESFLEAGPGRPGEDAALPAPGRLGPYEVLGVLGKGGMGVVLRAWDAGLRREVAVKVMRPDLARRPEARGRFLREARAAAQLQHDHVVPVYH